MTSKEECRKLRFVTWNTNGVKRTERSPKKMSKVLDSLRTLKADIAFIQETHIGQDDFLKNDLDDIFKKGEDENWIVFFTVHSTNSKGVAILIKKNIKFEYICHDEDCSGGYIVLFCYLYGELYTLVNVYNHKNDKFVLGRLKEYLLETAEGVLVVGGDFNTVLHPCLDRKPAPSSCSPLRNILEDFTVCLNLRDLWSYLNCVDEGFTRHQGESHSRIDMFFLQSDTLQRAKNITVGKNEITGEGKKISDHDPVVLELEVQQQTSNTIPDVGSFLEEFEYCYGIEAIISGAEILNAIKTLAYTQEERPGQWQVSYYKRHRCPMTEILKIKYNKMLKINQVSEDFKESYLSRGRHIFSAEYLIFCQILAKRLSVYMLPIHNKTLKTNPDECLTVRIEKGTQNIKLPFLRSLVPEKKLDGFVPPEKFDILKLNPFAPPTKFGILKHLLPQGSSKDLRLLQPDCPLSSTILNLALNELGFNISSEPECTIFICFQRQALHIHVPESKQEQIRGIVKDFQKDSGIKLVIEMIRAQMYVTARLHI